MNTEIDLLMGLGSVNDIEQKQINRLKDILGENALSLDKDQVALVVQFSGEISVQKLQEAFETHADIAGQVPSARQQPLAYPQP
jgi:hypothetical protein